MAAVHYGSFFLGLFTALAFASVGGDWTVPHSTVPLSNVFVVLALFTFVGCRVTAPKTVPDGRLTE